MSNANQQQSTSSLSQPKVARSKRAGRTQHMDSPLFEPNAAGIEIGAREIFVVVPPQRDTDPVRSAQGDPSAILSSIPALLQIQFVPQKHKTCSESADCHLAEHTIRNR